MRDVRGLEVDALEVADLDRMVDELVVVGRDVAAEAALVDVRRRQRRRDAPRGRRRLARRRELDFDGLVLAAGRRREHVRAVDERAPAVEIRAAHRLVERVHGQRHGQRPIGARAAPGRLRDLLDADLAAAARRADRDDVARELAQQIAARYPRRQPYLLVPSGVVHAQLDGEMMPIEVGAAHAVANQIECLRVNDVGAAEPRRRPCRREGSAGILSHRRARLAKPPARSYLASWRCPRGLKGNTASCGCPRNCKRPGVESVSH